MRKRTKGPERLSRSILANADTSPVVTPGFGEAALILKGRKGTGGSEGKEGEEGKVGSFFTKDENWRAREWNALSKKDR